MPPRDSSITAPHWLPSPASFPPSSPSAACRAFCPRVRRLLSGDFWDNSLLLFTADNGGIGGVGNNHPLRGPFQHTPFRAPLSCSAHS